MLTGGNSAFDDWKRGLDQIGDSSDFGHQGWKRSFDPIGHDSS